ncbi:MAG: large-conductance mechanosensitive channel protein MscL [Firmicutes bacterium]|nr:large-conductance mechanosensitive channel protein MscL [Bacillota bacterium]
MIREFKRFISRGNVMDMAVGVIIGSAFTAIVNSLVKDLLMPIIGIALGKVSFENLKIVLTPADEAAGIAESAINYGMFIQNIINFVLIALVVFMIVKSINNLKKKEEEPAPAPEPEPEPEPSEEVLLLREIRDSLKK